MALTEYEFDQWQAEQRAQSVRARLAVEEPPIANCMCCHQPFGQTGGFVTDGAALCFVCNSR